MALKTVSVRLYKETGVEILLASSRDAKLLHAQRFFRMFAYGATTIILAIYLADLGFSDNKSGLFMTLTLAGDVAISLFLTIFADAIGRRLSLAVGSILMVAGGVTFALSGVYWQLLVASIFGVVSPRFANVKFPSRDTFLRS
jgi:MFS family permease